MSEATKSCEQYSQWNWMMGYCAKNKIPPAQKWAWDRAKMEYQKMLDSSEAFN